MIKFAFHWQVPPSTAYTNMYDQWRRHVYLSVHQLLQAYSAEIESWMKQNALWIDRTGSARQSLHTDLTTLTNAIVLGLDHGVAHGVFLEYAHQGRYAIIAPALDYFVPKIMADVQKILS